MSYPPGVPAEVRTDTDTPIVDLLDESFRKYAARDAAACMDVRMRYRDIDDASTPLAEVIERTSVPSRRAGVDGRPVGILEARVPQLQHVSY